MDARQGNRTKEIVIAGLGTEICVAMPAIQALGDGYAVYVVTDR